MPIWRALAVMRSAKRVSLALKFSAITTAASFADSTVSALIASSTEIVSPGFRPSLVGNMPEA